MTTKLDLSEQLVRQSDIIPSKALNTRVTIVGAGATGSWSALLLAKMGMPNITIYDFDLVEIENMNSQFFTLASLGKEKVHAIRDNILAFTGIQVNAIDAKFEALDSDAQIVISAVDSMQSRKEIWEQVKVAKPKFLIDPRMAAETALIYTMSPRSQKDIESYEKTLYSDENSVQERCTAKSTIYTANLIAGQVCKIVKDIITKNPYVRIMQWDIAGNNMLAYQSK